MVENSEQPKEFDAVLGGENLPPQQAGVLGGLAGVKSRLASLIVEQRIKALPEALNYGEEGLELLMQALKDDVQVEIAAWEILQNSPEIRVRQRLEKYLTLLSDVDMVYFRLRDLLAAKDWNAADRRTRSILLRIRDREDLWLRREDIQQLPFTDLDTIDRLWRYYSKGRFGFSVQKRIWEDCAIKAKKQTGFQTYQLFCDRVGWKISEGIGEWKRIFLLIDRREDMPADLNAPIGHFPTVCAFGGGKRDSEPYTNDSESTMGFYSIDGYWSIWTPDSFFGPEMVESFLNRF